jgi:arylsulfatase A-like enzyme
VICYYEHSIRVPLILSGPRIEKGATSDAPVYLLDIFPTLCEYLGGQIPDSVEGISFAPLLGGKEVEGRESLFFAYADTLRSIKKGRFKYTLALVEGAQPIHRLYDVENDPRELSDLSQAPAHADILSELQQELPVLAEQWDDPKSQWGQRFWDKSGAVASLQP